MKILSIDPGNTKSGWILYGPGSMTVHDMGISDNFKLLDQISLEIAGELRCVANHMAYEMVASYGMPVGKSVFETCVWIGRFIQAWGGGAPVYRKDVKMHLCHSMRAKQSNIRQAIIDKFPPTGGGKIPQIGIKAKPGPLFGISSHLWSALGVALYYAETVIEKDNW